MTGDINANEKVFYTRDYCKGRGRSVGTVTLTDKRLISTVESKRSSERVELKIEEVQGVSFRFKPSSVALFIVGVLFTLLDTWMCFYLNKLVGGGMGGNGQNLWTEPAFLAQFIAYGLAALVCLIRGAINIRNGFYLGIKTANTRTDMIKMNAGGKFKPLKLKPKKADALELMSGMSAALIDAKHGSKN